MRDRVWVTGAFRRWAVDKVTNALNSVGNAYLRPGEIVAPRIVRVGFSLDF